MIEVRFENDYMRNSIKVYMFENKERARVFYTKGGEEARTIEDGSLLNDEEILFARIHNSALQAFAEALDKHGIKTDNDHKIAGTLEATKYHLEDMRKLAKVSQ